jgi:hypothetical protein
LGDDASGFNERSNHFGEDRMTIEAENRILTALFDKEEPSYKGICNTGIPAKTTQKNLKIL